MNINRAIRQATKFAEIVNAKSYAARCIGGAAFFHGHDGLYWVVTQGSNAKILREAGYEQIEI